MPSVTNDMNTAALLSPDKSNRRRDYIAPRNQTETILAGIWQELLGIEKVGMLDNFFDLGGDSLLVIREISMIRDLLKVEMSVKDFFVYNTIPALAEQVLQQEVIEAEPVIEPVQRPDRLPLSFSQERLWFIDKLEGSDAYHLTGAFRLKGMLNYPALQYALREMVNRHESLRTVFCEENGQVWQSILDKNQWQVRYFEHAAVCSDEDIKEYVQEVSSQPFDLAKDHPFRCNVLKQEDGCLIVFTVHHIASDGWSRNIIVRELIELYNSYIEGRPHNLASLPVQYADYALWQRQWFELPSVQNQLEYWKSKLAGVSALNLPLDHPRPVETDYKGAVLEFNISPVLTARLHELARQQDVTLFMLLLAAMKVLLYRYSGQEDICIGSPIAGRTRRETEQLIGLFINVLPLRSQVKGNISFADILKQVKQTTLDAYGNQDMPFEKIVQSIVSERDMSRNPLFQVMLILQNTPPIPAFILGDTELKEEAVPHVASMFEFTMSLTETSNGLRGHLEYATSLFNEPTMIRLLGHFDQLLQSIVANPQCEAGKLTLLTKKELEELANVFNATASYFPQDKGLADLFEEQVALTPDAVAIIQDKETITYRHLNERSNRLAWLLKEKGITDQSFIAICMDRSIDLIVSLLAVVKAGAVYVPIDPEYPVARIAYMLDDTNPVAILASASTSDKLLGYMDRLLYVDQKYDDEPVINPKRKQLQGKLLNIIYTSGSTGKPKGVMLTEQAVLNRIYWMWDAYPFENGEKCVCKTSIGFVDHICEIFSPLLHGVPFVIIDRENLVDIGKFIGTLGDQKVTRLLVVPSLLRAILYKIKAGSLELPDLKLWTTSGEMLPPELVDQFYEMFSPSTHTLLNIYGSTEVTADVSCYNTASERQKYMGHETDNIFEISWKKEIENITLEFEQRDSIVESLYNWNIHSYNLDETSDTPDYLDFLRQELLPGLVNLSSPGFIGHMTGPIPPFVRELDSLKTMLNQNLVKIETSSAATWLEKEVIATVHKLFYRYDDTFYNEQLPDPGSCLGVITNGGTLSNITALGYALNKKFAPVSDFRGIAREGLTKALSYYGYKNAVVIGSRSAHYSILKAMQTLGLGRDNFVAFDLDKKDLARSRKQLEQLIEELKSENTAVLAIVGVAGTTETGYIDPLPTLGEIAHEYGIHYHVDAAFGGAFIFSSRLSSKLKGIEYADTVTICAHKQLLLPVGVSLCLFKSHNFASHSENNTNYQARKNSFDLGRFTLEGSRPFDSLLLHAVLKMAGTRLLGNLVESNYRKTLLFASLISDHPGFELVGEPELNILNYRYIPEVLRDTTKKRKLINKDQVEIDGINVRLQQKQFEAGKSFVSYTRVKHPEYKTGADSIVVLRVVLMNPETTKDMLEEILEEQVALAEAILQNGEHSPVLRTPQLSPTPVRPPAGKLIGKPIANTRIYIMDAYMNPLPIGIPGEICVCGMAVSKGFLHLDKMTAERFVDQVVTPRKTDHLFRTGDVGKWMPDGNIEYLGRRDDQIKIRGYRVEPGEIEQVMQQSGLVRQSVVLLHEDKAGNQSLVGYVVADTFDQEQLMNYLQANVPSYMLPSIIMPLKEMPLNANGKINKLLLPKPEFHQLQGQPYRPPRNVTEEKLCSIWQELLGVEKVGIFDNFFALGGHSLLAFRMTAEIKKAFDIDLRMKLLFAHPTIASLAVCLETMIVSQTTLPEEYEEITL